MQERQFRSWLENHTNLQKATIDNAVSRCRRIESIPGINLDDQYGLDSGKAVLNLLSYSAYDQARGKPAPEGLDFSPGADLRNGLASLRSAAVRYFEFCRYRK